MWGIKVSGEKKTRRKKNVLGRNYDQNGPMKTRESSGRNRKQIMTN